MRNLNELWAQAVAQFDERTAVVHADRACTYRELEQLIGAFAGSLRGPLGIEPGDRVALIMPNCLQSIVCYLGAIRAGAIALPVNVRLKAEEMRFILRDAGAKSVVVHRAVWPTVREAIEGLDAPAKLVGIGFAEADVIALEELVQNAYALAPFDADADDVAAIIYTSGTTGLPKGAMITHGNVLFNVQSTIRGHGFRPEDVHILAVPLFHVTGLNTVMPTAFRQGARLIVTERIAPREILGLIARHRATTFFAVPTTMILLAQTPGVGEYDLSSLRLIAYSGAPMPVRTIEQLRRMFPGVELHNFFGLTETTSVTTVLEDEQALRRPESVGRGVPGLEVKVVDDEGSPLPPGEVGELLVRGPSVVKGYFNRPEATAEAIVDGWLHTGDSACMDEDGYVFLQGRKSEMILVAGENVYPVEVENVLSRHAGVAEVAVVGSPHTILGEVVKAVVVLQPNAHADAGELKRFCSEHLASFKVPRVIEFRDSLPRNPSGKVVKRELKD
jgi:long-chain acyl-CoA synthetase